MNSDKYKNKYRISSARLKTWDYSRDGSYFITICTKYRKHFFGEVKDGVMYLNEPGLIADNCWKDIPNHFKNVELGEYIVMPNHVHGILNINNPDIVETRHALSQPHALSLQHFRFRNQGKNTISSMIGSYKSAVTKLINNDIESKIDFCWQSRFHDHIIRSNEEYIRISKYIKNNPANWREDKFYRK